MKLIEMFPVSDAGEAHPSPKMFPLDWKFRLLNSREIVLTRIQQHQTYGGLLCGLPRAPEGKVSRAIEEAREWNGDFNVSPIVVPATILHGIRPTPRDPQFAHIEPTEWSMLPPVTTYAEFRSTDSALDIDEESTFAVLIWWQNHFGIPHDTDLLARLQSIDWT